MRCVYFPRTWGRHGGHTFDAILTRDNRLQDTSAVLDAASPPTEVDNILLCAFRFDTTDRIDTVHPSPPTEADRIVTIGVCFNMHSVSIITITPTEAEMA